MIGKLINAKGAGILALTAFAAAAAAPATAEDLSQYKGKKICYLMDSHVTEFSTVGEPIVFKPFRDAGVTINERVYNNDVNKQLEYARDCITQGVDGIGIFPQDGESALTIISEANKAGIPIAVFNRPPASDKGAAIVVKADNYKISVQTMEYLSKQGEKVGHKLTPLIMVGDLGDPNAVERRRGFLDVVAKHPDLYNDPIQVPTKWNAGVALANLQNAVQATPDIDLVFTSSDFLYPQIQAVLEPLGKWKKPGEKGKILIGGIDGQPEACKLMRQGYVDATGVQDLSGELHSVILDLLKASAAGKKKPDYDVVDPGVALTQANLSTDAHKMWGCVIVDAKS